MVTSANVWDMIDSYCTTNNKCIIKFNNSKIASASASKQAEVWTWYANFTEDSVLDMMKTLGTWDMVCLLYTSPSPRDQRGSRMPAWA